jgi:hypothetical protein
MYHILSVWNIVYIINMRIFIVVLLVLFSTSQLKANTIYNLIKIPNLEIYEINTKNKLKYFYAMRPFTLGVEKNIQCFDSDTKTLNSKYKIISKNLNRYSTNFLKKINLKYVVLCKNLSISGINAAGIPDHLMKTLILDINFNKQYFERVIHHEMFHIINDSFKKIFDEKKWSNLNEKKFRYAECSTCTDKWNLSVYNKTEGFLTEYSKTTPSEDMAEIFSLLMYNKNIIDEKIIYDVVLKKKVSLLKNNILKIDSSFKFYDKKN